MVTIEECGANCSYNAYVIRNDKIIFHTEDTELVGLIKAEDGNGFYLKWTPDQAPGFKEFAHCCVPGYRTTRFEFRDNKFVPTEESETLFTKVVDDESKKENKMIKSL